MCVSNIRYKIQYLGWVASLRSGFAHNQVSNTVLRPAATSVGLGFGTIFAASLTAEYNEGTDWLFSVKLPLKITKIKNSLSLPLYLVYSRD